jgi:hypothetical protein
MVRQSSCDVCQERGFIDRQPAPEGGAALRFPPPGQSTCASIAASECHPTGDRTSSRRAGRLVHVLAFVTILLVSLPSSRLCSPGVETKHPRRKPGSSSPRGRASSVSRRPAMRYWPARTSASPPTKFYDWLVACDDRHRLRRG